MIYLKKSTRSAETGQTDVRAAVEALLAEIERDGDAAAVRFSREFDKWQGAIVVSPEMRAQAARLVPEKLKDDIRFAHHNISRFAEAQRATVMDCTIEILPGLMAGPLALLPINAKL